MDCKECFNEADLANTERQIQYVLQSVHSVLENDMIQEGGQREGLRELEVELRQRMRVLRRWRNGTETYGADDSNDFQQNLLILRLENIRQQTDILKAALQKVDVCIGGGNICAQHLLSSRESVGSEVSRLRELFGSMSVDNSVQIMQCEETMIAVTRELLGLKKGIETASQPKTKVNKLRPTSKSFPSSVPAILRIEEHPEVNRVLRCAAHIRRMVDAFRDGRHVVTDMSPGCVDNDLEALSRQLHKVQLWQNSERTFQKSDVDDLELILSAIHNHIEPPFDASSPSRTSSRPNSRLSHSSIELHYTDPPSVSSEAPPSYDEACVETANMPRRDYNENEADNIGLINERLI